MESALDKDYALLRVVTKSPNGMFLVSCIDIFCLYTSSAPLSQSECDLDLFPAPGTGPLTLNAWQNIFPRYSPLAVFSRSCTGFTCLLRVKHVLRALYPARAHSNGRSMSRQTSGFSVILTRYVNKWPEKKCIFAQIYVSRRQASFFISCVCSLGKCV